MVEVCVFRFTLPLVGQMDQIIEPNTVQIAFND